MGEFHGIFCLVVRMTLVVVSTGIQGDPFVKTSPSPKKSRKLIGLVRRFVYIYMYYRVRACWRNFRIRIDLKTHHNSISAPKNYCNLTFNIYPARLRMDLTF